MNKIHSLISIIVILVVVVIIPPLGARLATR
ncbi:MAG: IlvGEDA operon leader peptide [Tolumonas sp.]|nr:IlvGEDA operon leader peptide [Tolumonas sp.]